MTAFPQETPRQSLNQKRYRTRNRRGFETGKLKYVRIRSRLLSKKGIEKGTEEASKLESLSVLGYDWGDEARGQYIYMYYIYIYYIYICIFTYIYIEREREIYIAQKKSS